MGKARLLLCAGLSYTGLFFSMRVAGGQGEVAMLVAGFSMSILVRCSPSSLDSVPALCYGFCHRPGIMDSATDPVLWVLPPALNHGFCWHPRPWTIVSVVSRALFHPCRRVRHAYPHTVGDRKPMVQAGDRIHSTGCLTPVVFSLGPSVFGRNLQCEPVRNVDTREECHWSHACSLQASWRGDQWHPRV
jgi:hypothetical protein